MAAELCLNYAKDFLINRDHLLTQNMLHTMHETKSHMTTYEKHCVQAKLKKLGTGIGITILNLCIQNWIPSKKWWIQRTTCYTSATTMTQQGFHMAAPMIGKLKYFRFNLKICVDYLLIEMFFILFGKCLPSKAHVFMFWLIPVK